MSKIFILIIALAIIAGGIFWWQKDNIKKFSFNKSEKPAPFLLCTNECGNGICQEIVCSGVGCPCAETKESCSQDCSSSDASNWQVYRNDEYGFELKYPADWDNTMLDIGLGLDRRIILAPRDTISKIKESIQNIGNDKFLAIMVSRFEKSQFEKGIMPYRAKSTENIRVEPFDFEVAGNKTTLYQKEYFKETAGYNIGDKTVTIDLLTGNSYLSIDLFDYQYLDIFNQILSTFKFIK